MQHLPEYDIRAFYWDASEQLFYAVKDDLWDINSHYNSIPFPNDRKQFIIRNPMTDGYRRFRFVKEQTDGNGFEYLFESEDGFRCIVLIEVATNQIELPTPYDAPPDMPIDHPHFIDVHLTPYETYIQFANQLDEPDYEWHVDDPQRNMTRPYTEDEFYDRCARDSTFKSMWIPTASEGTP